MKLAQIIGIIYLGIFPILPGCLCQVLAAFGVSVHDSSIPAAVCVISDDSGMLSCHCNHAEGKQIELPASSESDSAERMSNLALALGEPFEFHTSGDLSAQHDRAPPGNFVSPTARRVFSGVYLL